MALKPVMISSSVPISSSVLSRSSPRDCLVAWRFPLLLIEKANGLGFIEVRTGLGFVKFDGVGTSLSDVSRDSGDGLLTVKDTVGTLGR